MGCVRYFRKYFYSVSGSIVKKCMDMFLRINDKLLHFLACLVITLTVGELCAVTAGVTKEAADWMYKKNCKVGSGWDWLDILADAAGIAVGSVLRRLVFDY